MKISVVVVLAAVALFAIACGSESDNVASLEASDDTANVTQDAATDVEAAWITYTQCLRDNGLNVADPVVDKDGNVQKSQPIGDVELSKKELGEAYEACGDLLVGVTLEKDSVDTTEYVDGLLELTQCLRDQGIEVDDPDVSVEKPGLDLGDSIKKDWESPAMKKAREVCNVEAAFGGSK